MNNVYGNVVITNLQPPVPKQVEMAAAQLPATGAGTSSLIVIVLICAIAYFYYRNRQLIREVSMLRNDHHGTGGAQ